MSLTPAQIDAILQNADLPAIIGSVTPIQKRGGEYLCRCVFHSPDEHPSLSVYHAGNGSGRWRYRCFSCGADGDALDFLREYFGTPFAEALEQLNGGKVWTPKVEPSKAQRKPAAERVTSKPPADAGVPDMAIRALGEPVRSWCYRDADGAPLGYVARYEHEGKKEIRCWTWGQRVDQEPGWGCGHWAKPRPLYGLELLAQRPDASVLVTEGEKACDAARELLPSYVVVCWPGGAQAWKHADWEPIRERKVLLWPDADQPGIECMAELAAIITAPKGLACKVRILDVLRPGGNTEDEIPPGWDAADALAEHWTTEQVIAWAKPRASDYVAPQQPEQAPERIQKAQDEPPSAQASDYPPEPQNAPVTARAAKTGGKRPKLASVDGNAVRQPDPDAEPLPASLSEDALAEHFAEINGNWRYVKAWSAWFEWREDGWYRDDTAMVDRLAVKVTREAIYWPEAAALTLPSKQKINSKRTAGNLRDIASNDRRIAASVEQWDTHTMLLGVPGGVVDLTTGKTIPARAELYITKRTSVAPDPGDCPAWRALLERSTAGDASMIDYLQRLCGYILTGETREECFAFVYGPAQTGKSTFIRVLSEILGDYHSKAQMETFTESKHERHSEEIAVLAGARLVTATETEEGRRWNEARIKTLTGRDRIRARLMYQGSFEFDPQFKLMIAGNHAPHLRNVDDAMRRRLHIIPFTQPIALSERDDQLADKLRAEYPQILAWMIEGALEWKNAKLGRPDQMEQAVSEYMESEDTLGNWLSECVEIKSGARCLSGGAYGSFKRWSATSGEYVPSQKWFVKALKERGFDPKKVGGARYITGLELKPDVDGPVFDEDQGYAVP